jgi:hypothetical protein
VFYGKDFTLIVVLTFENTFCNKKLIVETTGMILCDSRAYIMLALAHDITEIRMNEETQRRMDRLILAQQSYSTR